VVVLFSFSQIVSPASLNHVARAARQLRGMRGNGLPCVCVDVPPWWQDSRLFVRRSIEAQHATSTRLHGEDAAHARDQSRGGLQCAQQPLASQKLNLLICDPEVVIFKQRRLSRQYMAMLLWGTRMVERTSRPIRATPL
jgi:hypothetical protein